MTLAIAIYMGLYGGFGFVLGYVHGRIDERRRSP